MKTTSTADRLNEIMRERNIKQIDILRAAQPFCEKYTVKLAKNDLSQYVNGKVEPGQEKLTILGLALNVSEAWLMGCDGPMEKPTQTKSSEPPARDPLERFNSLSPKQQEWFKLLLELTPDQAEEVVRYARFLKSHHE